MVQVLKPRTQKKLMIVGEDYQAVLSRYFDELPPFLGGKCCCPKCANEVETIVDHQPNGTSSGSEVYAGTSLDSNRGHTKIVTVGALLLWVFVFILAVYYHKLMLPQLYNRNAS